MSRLQFWILNLVSIVLVALLLSHFSYSRRNSRLGQELTNERATINQARQLEGALDQLAKRIAIGSEKDPTLRNLLLKYGLSVSLEINGNRKTYP